MILFQRLLTPSLWLAGLSISALAGTAAPVAIPDATPKNRALQSGAQRSPAITKGWQFNFEGARGVSLSYAGVPLIRQSSLYVVKPGWTGLLYDGRQQKYQVTRTDGAQPTLHAVGANEDFQAEYHLEALDEHRFRYRFRGELKRDVPAALEFSAGYFNANLLANRPFRAQTAGGEKHGIVPTFPLTSEQLANDLAPHFKTLEFDSRLGRLNIEVTSDARVVFFDARRDTQDWAKSAPVFWCGWQAGMQPLRFGAPVTFEMLIRLDPHPVKPDSLAVLTPQSAAFRPTLRPVNAAHSSRDRPTQIIPRPQRMVLPKATPLQLRSGARVSLLLPRGERRLTRALKKLLTDQWGLSLSTLQEHEHNGDATRITISSKRTNQSGLPEKQSSFSSTKNSGHSDQWRQTEGYKLRVAHDNIQIESSTARGAFHGLQTLAQLLRPLGKDGGVTCPAVVIEDWPALQFRGAHFFPSASGVPFHTKLIERVLARYKFNAVVIQCEATRWESAPALAAPNSISKSDLRRLVQLCRDNFIEPIPLINVPGHAEWMFRNGQNLDLAEDPKTPYAYAINNPRSLPFVQQILSEAIEVFRPRYFHIGHDEVTMRGRFPNAENPFYRPELSTGDLVLANLKQLQEWLQQQGIQPMIWGDMLLAKAEGVDAAHAPNAEEARRRRSLLPPNVTIVDWHYGANEKYPSLNIFQGHGLQIIAATWHTPLNIRHFTRAAAASKAHGLLQTTWAGYFPDETVLKNETRQFSAFVLAGDYAWSNREELPSALPYDAGVEWSEAYRGKGETNHEIERKGLLVDIAPVARVAPQDWLGLGAGWDFSSLFTKPVTKPALTAKKPSRKNFPVRVARYGDVLFQVPHQPVVLSVPEARLLAPVGALNNLTLDLSTQKTPQRASQIALLHASLWSVPVNTAIARLQVEYSDGTHSSWQLTQGQNISSWLKINEESAPEARRGWSAGPFKSEPNKGRVSSPPGLPELRITNWRNPYPHKPISQLQFEPLSPEAGWIIAGVTILQ
ncbi:MAG TPA: glycoside hydrolase family 20 zincin-like fold domain-containing protein [Abditibacteriaceae bacterium]